MKNKKPRFAATWAGGIIRAFAVVFIGVFVLNVLFDLLNSSELVHTLLYRVRDQHCVITRREITPTALPEHIAVNDDAIFVLFPAQKVIQAYSHEGAYQYTVRFPYTIKSQSLLYASGDEMYYRNVVNDVYYLKAGAFMQCYTDDEADQKLEELAAAFPQHSRASCEHEGYRYELDGVDVIRTGSDGAAETVIDLPEWMRYFDPLVSWCVGMACFVLGLATFAIARKVDMRPQRSKKK